MECYNAMIKASSLHLINQIDPYWHIYLLPRPPSSQIELCKANVQLFQWNHELIQVASQFYKLKA